MVDTVILPLMYWCVRLWTMILSVQVVVLAHVIVDRDQVGLTARGITLLAWKMYTFYT